jgi:hypothetical protein
MSENTAPDDLGPRTISDADAEAIATALERRMAKRFFTSFGKGVWAMAWKAVIYAVVAIAAYGTLKSGNFTK